MTEINLNPDGPHSPEMTAKVAALFDACSRFLVYATMGVKAGLDPSLMCDVINAGSGMNTATTQKFPRSVLPGTFDYGFGMALMVKDVRLFLAEAEDFGIPVEVAKAVGSLWEAAMVEHGERSDFTELAKTVEKRAGVQMRAKRK